MASLMHNCYSWKCLYFWLWNATQHTKICITQPNLTIWNCLHDYVKTLWGWFPQLQMTFLIWNPPTTKFSPDSKLHNLIIQPWRCENRHIISTQNPHMWHLPQASPRFRKNWNKVGTSEFDSLWQLCDSFYFRMKVSMPVITNKWASFTPNTE